MRLKALVCLTLLAVPMFAAGPDVISHQVAELKFMPVPDGNDCFTMAVERGDPAKEASFMIMRGKAGCAVPAHWHPSTETILMTKGSARADMKGMPAVTLAPQGFLSVPPKHVMSFRCVTDCELFLHTDGPFVIHYVDAAGHEISAAQANAKPAKK